MTDPFARLGAFIARKRMFVLIVWAVIAIACGGLLAPKAGGVLKAGGIGAPNSESDTADKLAEREFGQSVVNNVSIVFQSDTLTVNDQAYKDAVTDATDRLTKLDGVRSVTTFQNIGGVNLPNTSFV